MQKGFTLVEVLVTMAIAMILLSIGGVGLLGIQRKTVITTTVDKIALDIKSQQLAAMNGFNVNISFLPGSYTLTNGTSNFVVSLEDELEFTGITFANSKIIFAKGSGETGVAGSFILKDTRSGEEKRFNLNSLGNVYEIL